MYVFDKKNNVIIYGAATAGSMLVDRLKTAGVHVVGFIDKRAYEIDFLKGYRVWAIDSNELKEQIDNNTVIVIAVKNVFQHQLILKQLRKHTLCTKYVYMPLGNLDEKELIMKDVFNDLLYETISFPYELEEVKQIQLNNFFRCDNRVELDNKVVVLVPTGIVFTNCVKDSLWGDVPILAYFPHIRLFQFFQNDASGSVEAYLDFCVTASENMQIVQSDAWKNNILENRKNVYDQMLNEYELSMEFFYKNAPTAKWNEKGYFNLTSGKHRATFLVAQGRRYIPLKISLEDEEKWLNFKTAEKTYNYLEEQEVVSLEYTIDNPYFYKYKNTCGDFWNKVLAYVTCQMAEYLYQKYRRVFFEKLQVLNLFSDNRYVVRSLYKMGACITDLTEKNEVETKIDELVHCDYVPLRDAENKEYDLLFVKRMEQSVESERRVKFIICQSYEECYKDRAKKIATTIGSTEVVHAFWIQLD